MITTLKIFGTGQITIPKIWRDKYKTDQYIAQETPQGILLKPMVEELFYENGSDYFGINFPLGIDAKELATKLEATQKQLKKSGSAKTKA